MQWWGLIQLSPYRHTHRHLHPHAYLDAHLDRYEHPRAYSNTDSHSYRHAYGIAHPPADQYAVHSHVDSHHIASIRHAYAALVQRAHPPAGDRRRVSRNL